MADLFAEEPPSFKQRDLGYPRAWGAPKPDPSATPAHAPGVRSDPPSRLVGVFRPGPPARVPELRSSAVSGHLAVLTALKSKTVP